MRLISSRGKQSQLGGQNWFDEKSELALRMEMRFWVVRPEVFPFFRPRPLIYNP